MHKKLRHFGTGNRFGPVVGHLAPLTGRTDVSIVIGKPLFGPGRSHHIRLIHFVKTRFIQIIFTVSELYLQPVAFNCKHFIHLRSQHFTHYRLVCLNSVRRLSKVFGCIINLIQHWFGRLLSGSGNKIKRHTH